MLQTVTKKLRGCHWCGKARTTAYWLRRPELKRYHPACFACVTEFQSKESVKLMIKRN